MSGVEEFQVKMGEGLCIKCILRTNFSALPSAVSALKRGLPPAVPSVLRLTGNLVSVVMGRMAVSSVVMERMALSRPAVKGGQGPVEGVLSQTV